jgi:hypothetical protein
MRSFDLQPQDDKERQIYRNFGTLYLYRIQKGVFGLQSKGDGQGKLIKILEQSL